MATRSRPQTAVRRDEDINISTGDLSNEKPKKEKWKAIPRTELPSFLKDNEFILHGHRPQIESFREIFKSLFRMHTETLNIWTHLLGCLVFLVHSVYVYMESDPNYSLTLEQKIWHLSFHIGGIICMGLSATYHLVSCHSKPVYSCFSKLDYAGIIVLIVGSFPPWVYYGFLCDPFFKYLYLISIIVLGIICIVAVLHDKFGTPRYRALRAALFSVLGLMGAFPGLHYAAYHGIYKIRWLLIMAAFYLFGGAIYAVRIPERLAPGKFDILGQSHQILHICVIFGVMSCLIGISELAQTEEFYTCS